MKTLRDNIQFFPDNKGGGDIYDPLTDKTYQLGEVEYYLLGLINGSLSEEEIAKKCSEKFGRSITVQDVHEFIRLIDSWGLLISKPSGSDLDKIDGAKDEQKEEGAPNHWHIFNPEKLFDIVNEHLRSLQWLAIGYPVLVALGTVTAFRHWEDFVSDFSLAWSHFGFVSRVLFALVTINFVSQLARGIVARTFGMRTPSFGLRLMLGLIPRFNVHVVPNGEPSRHERLWLSSISTLIRLAIFSIGVMLWYVEKGSGSMLSMLSMELAALSIISLLFVANPLWPGDGSNFLSALLQVPNIHRRSRFAFWGIFIRPPEVVVRHTRHRYAWGMLGLAIIAFFIGFVAFIGYHIFNVLEESYQGLGVSAFFILAIYISVMKRKGRSAKNRKSEGSFSNKKGNSTTAATKYFLLLILLLISMCPYQYETGGEAELFARKQASIFAESSGVVDHVFVEQGEWVKKGSKIANISDDIQKMNVFLAEDAVHEKEAELRTLLTTPTKQEIRYLEAQLASAMKREEYSSNEFRRKQRLFSKGVIPEEELENAKKSFELDKASVHEVEAELAALKAQINPNQIAAAKAGLEEARHNLRLRGIELQKTFLAAPIEGRIVTDDIGLKQNSYVKIGDLFAVLEDDRTLTVKIAIPEFDAGEVHSGSRVHLRLWAYPNRIFDCKVRVIGSHVEEYNNSKVVFVEADIDNSDHLLKSGMTGFAKVEGEDTILAFAFSRALMRFILVEIWSWLP